MGPFVVGFRLVLVLIFGLDAMLALGFGLRLEVKGSGPVAGDGRNIEVCNKSKLGISNGGSLS